MYCDGMCEHLDCKKKKCVKHKKKLTYAKYGWGYVFEKCDECKFPERFVKNETT
jgi:hypothetical protein